MTKVSVSVHIGEYFGTRYCQTIEVDVLRSRCFEPLRACDDPMFVPFSGEMLAGSRQYQEVVKMREDAARYLAGKLAEMIIAAMQNEDTVNGYVVKK